MSFKEEAFWSSVRPVPEGESPAFPWMDNLGDVAERIAQVLGPKQALSLRRLTAGAGAVQELIEVHPDAGRAAFAVWKQDLLSFARKLDAAGLPDAIARAATGSMGAFSFAEQGEVLARQLGLDRVIRGWAQSPARASFFWSVVDLGVRDLSAWLQAHPDTPLALAPLVAACEADERDDVLLWSADGIERGDRSKFGTFCSIAAIGLGGLAGGAVGVAGILIGAAYMAYAER